MTLALVGRVQVPLRIVRLKPCATCGELATPDRGPGEWLVVQNTGSTRINLGGVRVCRWVPGPREAGTWEIILTLDGALSPSEEIAVHTGHGFDEQRTLLVDILAADRHVFARRDHYLWNTSGGDVVAIVRRGSLVDQAVTVGNRRPAVLERKGDELVGA